MSPDTKAKTNDAGQAEVQSAFDEANRKGYFGAKVDPEPNSAYSLESGPDSPRHEDTDTRVAQHVLPKEDKNA